MCFLLWCKCPEAVLHRCSSEKWFCSAKPWRYYYLHAKTQEIYRRLPMQKCDFNKAA